MFKKPDAWQSGIKMVTKFFGFESDEQNQKSDQKIKQTGLIRLKSSNQRYFTNQSQQKSITLRQKWRKQMRFDPKLCIKQCLQLLKQGSALQQQTWIWMLPNSQKITLHLYNLKRQQLNTILYPKNISTFQINQSNMELYQYQQKGKENLYNIKKKKMSITKGAHETFGGKLSLTSQASTFSSQTSNSQDIGFCQSETRYVNQNQSLRMPTKMQQSGSINPVRYQKSSFKLNISLLPSKIIHPIITTIIGSLLLHRPSLQYNTCLFNISATLYYYTNSNQLKTFILLNHICTTECFVHFLEGNQRDLLGIVGGITQGIRKNCEITVFLKHLRLESFVQLWFYGFFYLICQNGTELKEKIIGYLLIHQFSIASLTKLCQSIIYSLKRIINKNDQQQTIQCLQNPKHFLDKEILLDYLFQVDN